MPFLQKVIQLLWFLIDWYRTTIIIHKKFDFQNARGPEVSIVNMSVLPLPNIIINDRQWYYYCLKNDIYFQHIRVHTLQYFLFINGKDLKIFIFLSKETKIYLYIYLTLFDLCTTYSWLFNNFLNKLSHLIYIILTSIT